MQTTAQSSAPVWVVLLYAHWHVPSTQFAPAFDKLAAKYGGGGEEVAPLRFGRLDLAHWPGLASRYGVAMNTSASALPALLLLQGGALLERVPRLAAKGGVVRGQWRMADVERAFRLAERAAAPVPSAEAKKML